MDSDTQDRIKKAAALKRALGSDEETKAYESDYPTVEIARIWKSIMEYMGDDENEALSQLDMGEFKNFYKDETKLFAIAIHFSEHPFDDIEMEFKRRGIMRKVMTKPSVHNIDDTITPEEYKYEPIKFVVIPLRTFAKEWMKKRHPVNRKRVRELIDLVTGSRLGDNFNRRQQDNLEQQTITSNKKLV